MTDGTAKEWIRRVLSQRAEPLCDDRLVEPASLSIRQQAYHACSALAAEGAVQRETAECARCGRIKMVTTIGVGSRIYAAKRRAWSTSWRFPRSRWPVEEHLAAVDDDFPATGAALPRPPELNGPHRGLGELAGRENVQAVLDPRR